MTRYSRQAIREALGVLLAAALTSAQTVYDEYRTDFNGQSPVICLASGGSGVGGTGNGALTARGWRATYQIQVLVFVTRDSASGYSSDDALDAIAEQLWTALEANRDADFWQNLQLVGVSDIVPVEIGGSPYWLETFNLQMESY